LADELGTIRRVTADNGYYSRDNVEDAADRKATPYMATARQSHHPDWKQRLAKPDPPPEDPTPLEAMQWRLNTKQAGSSTQGESPRSNQSLESSRV